MTMQNPKIVFLGVGAIGGSVGGWIAPHYDNLFFMDRGEMQAAIKAKGLSVYPELDKAAMANVRVKVIDSLDQARDADVVAIAVKNYDLEQAAKLVADTLGNKLLIVSSNLAKMPFLHPGSIPCWHS